MNRYFVFGILLMSGLCWSCDQDKDVEIDQKVSVDLSLDVYDLVAGIWYSDSLEFGMKIGGDSTVQLLFRDSLGGSLVFADQLRDSVYFGTTNCTFKWQNAGCIFGGVYPEQDRFTVTPEMIHFEHFGDFGRLNPDTIMLKANCSYLSVNWNDEYLFETYILDYFQHHFYRISPRWFIQKDTLAVQVFDHADYCREVTSSEMRWIDFEIIDFDGVGTYLFSANDEGSQLKLNVQELDWDVFETYVVDSAKVVVKPYDANHETVIEGEFEAYIRNSNPFLNETIHLTEGAFILCQ